MLQFQQHLIQLVPKYLNVLSSYTMLLEQIIDNDYTLFIKPCLAVLRLCHLVFWSVGQLVQHVLDKKQLRLKKFFLHRILLKFMLLFSTSYFFLNHIFIELGMEFIYLDIKCIINSPICNIRMTTSISSEAFEKKNRKLKNGR